MKILMLLFVILNIGARLYAQNTNISGVINTYQSVSSIAGNTVTLNSTAGFSQGDLVLLIQLQGATIDESNSGSFGDIISYNNAGNYELLTVCNVPNSTDLMVSNIQRSYDPAGIVQIVKVPVYDDATVTAALTADPWDGSTGGVLAFKCNGDLTLNADIDLTGAGFNGAAINNSSFSCQWFINNTDYFYNISSGQGALKGEGNALFITNKTSGRGAQSNGGGGGNDHNSGGGGGGNGAAGGNGGNRIGASAFTCSGPNPGVGGKAQTYNNTENRIFPGGGGGAGHQNNAGTSNPAGNGGGIVIIIADRIVGNAQSIIVKGAGVLSSEDGASGGGAGGTILLDVNNYSGTLNVDISGGDGGDVGNLGGSNCNGPGGGGGGGVIWYAQASTPGAISVNNSGGLNGITTTATQSNCVVGGANNATAGGNGLELFNLVIPTPVPAATGTDTVAACNSYTWLDGNTFYADTLGASYTFFGGASSGCDSTVILDLTVNTVDTSVVALIDTLIVTGLYDSLQWYMGCGSFSSIFLGEIDDTLIQPGTGGQDFFAVIYYNGCFDTTLCYHLGVEGIEDSDFSQNIQIYPNPNSGIFIINLGEVYQNIQVEMLDMSGRKIEQWVLESGSEIPIQTSAQKGQYLLRIQFESRMALKRILIE